MRLDSSVPTLCQNSLGRVSITSDIWSRQNLESYMAVTAHYCAKSSKTGNLLLKSQLVAFRNLRGSHTGINIGKEFVRIVKEIGCLHKVCHLLFKFSANSANSLCIFSIAWDGHSR